MNEKLKKIIFYRKNRQSVIYSWSRSYIYITVIFILIFIVISFATSGMYRRQMEHSDEYLIEHTGSVLDGVFEGLKNSSSNIWLDSDVISLFNVGEDISDQEYAEINEIVKNLKRAQISNGNIQSLSIIDAQNDRVYTTGGVIDLATFYSITFPQDADGYGAFVEKLNSNASEAYLISTGEISYIRGFGYSGKDNLNQSIIITVNIQTFIDQLRSIENLGGGNDVYIMGADGELMVSTGGDIYKDIDVSSLKGNIGSDELRHGGRKYVLWYQRSEQGDWYYIMAHSESQYIIKLMLFQTIFGIGFIIVLICVGMYMHRFINRNYGSLFAILNMLGRRDDENAPQNEFDVIAAGIEDMLKANKNLDKRIYDQNRILRNTFLEKLCCGLAGSDTGALSDYLYIYDIKFTGDKFLALVIFLDEELETGSGCNDYSFQQIVFIISNVMEELINKRHYGILFECRGIISGIININEEHEDTLKDDMKEVVLRTQEFIAEHFGIKFTVAFSSMFENIENADKGYIEAVDTMKYKYTMGIDDTLFGEDMGNMSRNGYHYPFETERQLGNLIRAGNAEDAKKLVQTIIDENVDNKQLAPDLIQYLMLNILSTVVRTMNEMAIDDSETILKEADIISDMAQAGSLRKKTEMVCALIDRIAGMAVKTSGEKNSWIITGVIPYIEENYTDCNLSVSMIAEHFGMHPVYTSRLFKEQTGVGLFEYISKYRIDKSKEILVNTDYTLERVAEQVGYATSRTFARMFKKTEGITPGKYREMHHNKDDI